MAATLSPAMLAPSSPEHDDPSDWLAEGERWAGEMPLRRGIHAQAQTKLCMLQLHFTLLYSFRLLPCGPLI